MASCWKAVLRLGSGQFAGSSGASSELHESSSAGQHTGFECETQLNHECRRLVHLVMLNVTLVGETCHRLVVSFHSSNNDVIDELL